eukprot:gene8189-1447_t
MSTADIETWSNEGKIRHGTRSAQTWSYEGNIRHGSHNVQVSVGVGESWKLDQGSPGNMTNMSTYDGWNLDLPRARFTMVATMFSMSSTDGETWSYEGNIRHGSHNLQCPELGRFPHTAPSMSSTDGETWSYEGKIRHGSHDVQAVLRRLDNSYWLEGPTGILEVSLYF